MPIFEYQCEDCDTVIELFERSETVAAGEYCPVCKCLRCFDKIISAPAVLRVNGFSEANGYARKDTNEQA